MINMDFADGPLIIVKDGSSNLRLSGVVIISGPGLGKVSGVVASFVLALESIQNLRFEKGDEKHRLLRYLQPSVRCF